MATRKKQISGYQKKHILIILALLKKFVGDIQSGNTSLEIDFSDYSCLLVIHPANSETPFNSLEKKCVRSRNSKSVAIFRRLLKESNLKIIRLFCRRSLLSVIYYGCQILTQTISFRDCDFKATFSGHVSRTNQGPPVLNNE